MPFKRTGVSVFEFAGQNSLALSDHMKGTTMRMSVHAASATLCATLLGASPAFANSPTPIKPPVVGATAGTWEYLSLSNGFLYDVLLPYGYSGAHTYPIILYLHGSGTSQPAGSPPWNAFPGLINSTSVQGVNYRADYPAIVVAPQCPNSANGSNDWGGTHTTIQNGVPVNTVDMPCGDNAITALNTTIKSHFVDPTKVYITGYSMGGFGTWYLYATHTTLFAAAIPVAGSISGGATPASFEKLLLKKPVWAFHGFDDTTVSKAWDEMMYTTSGQTGGIMKYIEFIVSGDSTSYPTWLEQQNGDGHGNADTSAYVNTATLNWLFAQSYVATPKAATRLVPMENGL